MADLRGGTTISGYLALHSGLKDAYLAGTLSIGGDGKIYGGLVVNGESTIGSNLTVSGDLSVSGKTTVNDLYITSNKGIFSKYNNNYVFKDHGNGNITISAAGSQLYLGYQATTGIRLNANMVGNDGTTKISDANGKQYYMGADMDGRYLRQDAISNLSANAYIVSDAGYLGVLKKAGYISWALNHGDGSEFMYITPSKSANGTDFDWTKGLKIGSSSFTFNNAEVYTTNNLNDQTFSTIAATSGDRGWGINGKKGGAIGAFSGWDANTLYVNTHSASGPTKTFQKLYLNGDAVFIPNSLITSSTASSPYEGIEMMGFGSPGQGGGVIAFRENANKGWGFTLGYNGENTDNAMMGLNIANNSFAMLRHDNNNPAGTKVMEVPRSGDYVRFPGQELRVQRLWFDGGAAYYFDDYGNIKFKGSGGTHWHIWDRTDTTVFTVQVDGARRAAYVNNQEVWHRGSIVVSPNAPSYAETGYLWISY